MNRRIFTVIFTIASIVINCMCSYLAGLVAFPLYLDSLLTIAVTALCGLIPGIVCAIASNALLCIFANTGILFMLCHICTSGILFRTEKSQATFKLEHPLYGCFLHNRKFYVDRFYLSHYQFNSGRHHFLSFLLSKYLHSSSRQRRSRNLCCNTELNICGILRRHRYKFDR